VVPAAQSDLAARYTAFLAGVPDGLAKAGGVAAGETAAAAMLAARANDGRNGAFRFVTGTGPGRWRPEPPAFVSDPVAWLKDVKPFVVRSASQLRADAPDPLTSRRYARDYDEVKSMGSATSTVRTADQTSAARFWAENGPRTWSRILRTLAGQRDASTAVNARLYAMAYMATADALITVWEGKAQWSFWRPITAIRQTGGERGDPAWAPLIDTPPYPDHPSGLSAVAAAMVRTAQLVFGTDGVAFSDTNVAGIARSFTTLSQAANEVVDARVWSGIHFRNADTQGAAIGVDVAEWSARHYFRPARGDEEDDVVHVGGDGD
jgi:hypothetical protein